MNDKQARWAEIDSMGDWDASQEFERIVFAEWPTFTEQTDITIREMAEAADWLSYLEWLRS